MCKKRKRCYRVIFLRLANAFPFPCPTSNSSATGRPSPPPAFPGLGIDNLRGTSSEHLLRSLEMPATIGWGEILELAHAHRGSGADVPVCPAPEQVPKGNEPYSLGTSWKQPLQSYRAWMGRLKSLLHKMCNRFMNRYHVIPFAEWYWDIVGREWLSEANPSRRGAYGQTVRREGFQPFAPYKQIGKNHSVNGIKSIRGHTIFSNFSA